MSQQRASRWKTGSGLAATGLLALLVALGSPARAQQGDVTPAQAEADGAADPADTEEIDRLLEQEAEDLAGQGYTYDDEGRRDPFVSLLRRGPDVPDTVDRPDGPAGLLIDQIDIRGILNIDGEWVAMVEAPDQETSFLLHEGDKLFDGDIVSISANEIKFKQLVKDPRIFKPFREVVKKLNPES